MPSDSLVLIYNTHTKSTEDSTLNSVVSPYKGYVSFFCVQESASTNTYVTLSQLNSLLHAGILDWPCVASMAS